jgi:hypothetical protein
MWLRDTFAGEEQCLPLQKSFGVLRATPLSTKWEDAKMLRRLAQHKVLVSFVGNFLLMQNKRKL